MRQRGVGASSFFLYGFVVASYGSRRLAFLVLNVWEIVAGGGSSLASSFACARRFISRVGAEIPVRVVLARGRASVPWGRQYLVTLP